jgi:hypothetical protein
MIAVNVRYMVDDVDAAVAFYTTRLSFTLLTKTTHAFADVAMAPRTMSGTPIGLDAPQCASVEAGAPPLLSTGGGRGSRGVQPRGRSRSQLVGAAGIRASLRAGTSAPWGART